MRGVRSLSVVALVAASVLLLIPVCAQAAAPPDPGQTLSFTYGSGLSAYPYLVYVPASYDAARPAPLLVMAHGCQTTAEQQMRANLYNPIAEREGFIVLYPDIDPVEAAQPGPLRRCWQFPSPLNWHRDSQDPVAIAAMTHAVMDRWTVDAERVYLMGMSAGSFMTSVMSAAYPDLYAAVGIMAGGAYADGTCLVDSHLGLLSAAQSAQMAYAEEGARARVVPRLVMGGDSDRGIPPACADKAFAQGLRTNNLVISGRQDRPISLRPAATRMEPKAGGYASTVDTYLDPDGCEIGERWTIHGMDHFWSGGTSDPTYKDFTDPKGPSGAEISWRFFSRYTKSSTAMPCAEAPAALPPAGAAKPCRARWLTVRFAGRAATARATVNGRAAKARVVHGRVQVRLPAGPRARTSIVLRGRTAAGRAVTRRVRYGGCGA